MKSRFFIENAVAVIVVHDNKTETAFFIHDYPRGKGIPNIRKAVYYESYLTWEYYLNTECTADYTEYFVQIKHLRIESILCKLFQKGLTNNERIKLIHKIRKTYKINQVNY